MPTQMRSYFPALRRACARIMRSYYVLFSLRMRSYFSALRRLISQRSALISAFVFLIALHLLACTLILLLLSARVRMRSSFSQRSVAYALLFSPLLRRLIEP